MQFEQMILFVAVAALALALVLVVVVPRIRRGGRAERSQLGSRGGFSPERPPIDLTPQSPLSPPKAAVPPPPPPVAVMLCPTCRRQYAPGLRFCPYDARVLISEGHPVALDPGDVAGGAVANPGKICPICARRYDAVAMVCGRDGSALVSVN